MRSIAFFSATRFLVAISDASSFLPIARYATTLAPSAIASSSITGIGSPPRNT